MQSLLILPILFLGALLHSGAGVDVDTLGNFEACKRSLPKSAPINNAWFDSVQKWYALYQQFTLSEQLLEAMTHRKPCTDKYKCLFSCDCIFFELQNGGMSNSYGSCATDERAELRTIKTYPDGSFDKQLFNNDGSPADNGIFLHGVVFMTDNLTYRVNINCLADGTLAFNVVSPCVNLPGDTKNTIVAALANFDTCNFGDGMGYSVAFIKHFCVQDGAEGPHFPGCNYNNTCLVR